MAVAGTYGATAPAVVKLSINGKLLGQRCNTRQEVFTAIATRGETMKRSFQMRAFLRVWVLPLWIACGFISDMAFAQLQVTRMQVGCPEDGAACSGAVVI
jgi:hypothetical protein